MAGQIWLGNTNHAQWAPAPATGMTRTNEGYSEEIEFDNGGLWVNNSAATHAVYDMQFPVQDSSMYEGIEYYDRLASDEYGPDYIRFVDPMAQDQNLFSPVWASPMLTEMGWKPIYDTIPTFSATTANTYNKPYRKATYNITSAANAAPVNPNSIFTFIIPPGYRLMVGWSGAVTGTAVLANTSVGVTVTGVATPTADTAVPSLTQTFTAGSSGGYVRLYFTRTTTAASTVTVASMWAQILAPASSPNISRHIPGKGHAGLAFRGNARAVTYTMANRHLAGASITLAEVEPWA